MCSKAGKRGLGEEEGEGCDSTLDELGWKGGKDDAMWVLLVFGILDFLQRTIVGAMESH